MMDEPEQYDEVYQMYKEMASLIRGGMPGSDSGSNNNQSEEEKKSGENDSKEDDDDDDDDFGTDRDIDWTDARQRKKSPFRGIATEPHPHQKNALEEEIKHDSNGKQYFDHTLQTIQEAAADAEGTFQNTDKQSTLPGNGQDTQRQSTEESEDREDMAGDDESSTDVS